jgi:hypothetical protein
MSGESEKTEIDPTPGRVPGTKEFGHRNERRRSRNAELRDRSEQFSVAKRVLGPRFRHDAVADVVDVVNGYATTGLRDSSGTFRPMVIVAVRAVAGQPCDEQLAVTLLQALEASLPVETTMAQPEP